VYNQGDITPSEVQLYKNYLADLAQYGIMNSQDLAWLCKHQNPTMHSNYIYTALLYKVSQDISGDENWCLSNTFTEELLVEAYKILSASHGETMTQEKFNSELIRRVLFFTLQKFSMLQIEDVGRFNASKADNHINGLSPFAYMPWGIQQVVMMLQKDKQDFVIGGLRKMVDAHNLHHIALRPMQSSDSSDLSGPGQRISQDKRLGWTTSDNDSTVWGTTTKNLPPQKYKKSRKNSMTNSTI
jgi:hypothetical protein